MTAGDGLPGLLAAVAVGSLLAAVVAVGLSPVAPLGSVRAVYPYPGIALDWVRSSHRQKSELDRDAMAEVFLRYKGAEAGEVDWLPTETIPEDFYAM